MSLPSAVHVLQKFYTDDNCQVENTALTEAMYPQNNVAPDGFTDPSYEEGVCSELVGPLFSGDIVIPFEHSGKLRCGPGNCEATLDWYVGSKTCDDDSSRVESMTFTFPPGCYGRDDVRVRRDEWRACRRGGVLRGRPGLLARHPVPRVLARPDAVAPPRVLRVQLSTPGPGHHACP